MINIEKLSLGVLRLDATCSILYRKINQFRMSTGDNVEQGRRTRSGRPDLLVYYAKSTRSHATVRRGGGLGPKFSD